jgi:hypothetical protein
MTDYNIDQTQFAAEEPLFEQPVKIEAPQPTEAPKVEPSSKKSTKRIAIVGGLLFFILLIIILLAAALRKPSAPTEEEAEFTSEEEQRIMGPFSQRISELENQLELADPSQEDLPFPPVDMEIKLD